MSGDGMKYLLYASLSLPLLVGWLLYRRREKKRAGFSGDWWADERLKVLRRAAEFEGVSHTGRFKR